MVADWKTQTSHILDINMLFIGVADNNGNTHLVMYNMELLNPEITYA